MSYAIAMFGLPGLLIYVALLVGLCVHAVRSGQDTFWLWIILLLQPIGALVYVVIIILPRLFGGTTARRVSKAARETLDPGRDYREAKAAYDLTPTVQNQMRLAHASGALGRWDEAEALYGEALQGIHEDDPALLMGRARALIELDRPAEALGFLDRLAAQGEPGRSPQATLAFARAYEALGRNEEADAAYLSAEGRVPGLEGMARHAAFLAKAGRRAEAQAMLAEMDKRVSRANAHFRKEARAWRDFAARALG